MYCILCVDLWISVDLLVFHCLHTQQVHQWHFFTGPFFPEFMTMFFFFNFVSYYHAKCQINLQLQLLLLQSSRCVSKVRPCLSRCCHKVLMRSWWGRPESTPTHLRVWRTVWSARVFIDYWQRLVSDGANYHLFIFFCHFTIWHF